MHSETYQGINAFLTGASRLLVSEGRKRETRGQICYELPEPFLFKITDPTARIVTIPEREWVRTLPYAESLWIASGRNDLAYITHYLKRMADFSDDGVYMRGGYGPRCRDYNGSIEDYHIETINIRQKGSVDQLRYVVECFKQDIETRRAVISFGDPMKDDFDENGCLKQSRDIPCTRELHFMKQPDSNKLDLIVKMRSNDFIWGASAVNVFNYTFMQEYVSTILGLELGSYYHLADNFHYYERHQTKVHKLAEIYDIEEAPVICKKTFSSLKEFDALISKLGREEELMRTNLSNYKKIYFEDPYFDNWYNELLTYNMKKRIDYNSPK